MDRAAVDWARDLLVERGATDGDPEAVLFLLREHVASGDERVRHIVEQGLTTALFAVEGDADVCVQLRRIRMLAEAGVVSDDERLADAARQALPAAVDALEQYVRRTYEPGEGLVELPCDRQLRWAGALLDAFDLSGRLPYAMLADELLHYARRRWWRDAEGRFDSTFDANCRALGALCRLAALHGDAEYRAATTVPPNSACASDARLLAAQLAAIAREHPAYAATFGCAMLDWFALESNLQ